ncbi:MAG TPA: DEAD/DEAH box helicase, partial [bacterium]|nr:DEAD/DEAH box helicase [bacterium]
MQDQIPPVRSQLQGLVESIALRLPQGGRLRLAGVRAGARAWLIAALAARVGRPLVVVMDGLAAAEDLQRDLECWAGLGRALLFPHWDTIPYDGFSPQKDTVSQRFQALAALQDAADAHGDVQPVPPVLVTTPQALMQGMLDPAVFRSLRFTLRQGGRYARPVLLERLQQAGFHRVDLVEAPGEFSVRGEIVDLFPIQAEHPVRLDFFDDELESLRAFDVGTQKSFEPLAELDVYPASEGVVTAETAARALAALPHHKAQVQPEMYRQVRQALEQGQTFPGFEQHLGLFYERVAFLHQALPANAVWVLDRPEHLARTAAQFHDEVLGEYELCLRQANLALPPDHFYLTPAAWQAQFAGRQHLELEELLLEDTAPVAEGEPRATLLCPFADNTWLRTQALEKGGSARAALEKVLAQLKTWRNGGAHVLLAARSRTGAERLRQLLAEFDLAAMVAPTDPQQGLAPLLLAEAPGQEAPAPELLLLAQAPQQGFRVVDEGGETRLALVTEEELLGEKTRQRRLKKSKLQHFIASLGELKEGDLVVHVEYGIGRYDGLKRLHAGQEEGDFLVLSYAGSDKVYVPVYKLNQVQKFTGIDGAGPALSRLGDGAWSRSKQRARAAVQDMAEELIKLYAARKARQGHAFEPHQGLLTEFEEAFPFQETEDQQRAIEEVLADMARDLPMDRLVCGDVGFGKTEVAMRAAYLAVLGKKQVMMLVPTTILAQQHLETFTKRFQGFAVSVDVLSRFRTPHEQRQVLKAFGEGKLDILIGTHRLLSQDVQPHDLGLLVIDEEQRFGVAHKEKIKQLKTQVDV